MHIPSSFSPAQLRNIRQLINDESTEAASLRSREANDGQQDVIVLDTGRRSFDGSSLMEALGERGVQVQEKLDDIGVAVRLSPEKAEELKEQGFQVFDNSPIQMQPDLPQASTATRGNPWDKPDIRPVEMTRADKLHQAGATGKGAVIAVLDSGFDFPAYNDKLVAWRDVTSAANPKPHDGSGHGTHVIGDVLKTAPDAGIVAIKVMNDDGTGSPLDIIKGLKEVAKLKKEGVNIQAVNMSLGGAPDGLPDTLGPINIYVEKLDKMGITVIAAAGNSGPDKHTIGSPADSPSAIAIGSALNPTTVSDFSSRGPTDDGLERPDVLAPGEFISSWGVPYSEMYKTAQSVERIRAMDGGELKEFLKERPKLIEALGLPEDILSRPDEEVEKEVKPKLPPVYLSPEGEVAAPGTSFAAPLTAGIAIALESIKDITPDETREILKSTADNMGNYTTIEQGAGFVNAEKALEKVRG